MPGRVAFLTLSDRRGWVIDDDLAIAELARRGVPVDEVSWEAPGRWWAAYAGVVIRTPWDYQRDLPAFLALLDAIEADGVPLANPTSVVRWNAHKSYMRLLSAQNVPVVPGESGHGLDAATVLALSERLGPCVLKPAVGASGQDTFRLPGGDAVDIASRFAHRDWLAQPFVASILTEGEYSLFYFFGRYSHAIQKRPCAGEFRVQEEHGGEILAAEADAEMQRVALAALGAIGQDLLQARVDLVRLADGSLAVMELELIEPSLYFRMHPNAPAAFADAVQAWLVL